jgi:hypothetical protein
MVLNPNLYHLLRMEWGEVKVINQGLERIEGRDDKGNYQVVQRGEHYNVCCPLCGDSRFRLSISYCWLSTSLGMYRNKTLAQCYNESCPVTEDEFIDPLIDTLEMIEAGLIDIPSDVVATAPQAPGEVAVIRLPGGLIPLAELEESHPAVQFIHFKYPRMPLSTFISAGVAYAAEADPLCYPAHNRLIFPIVYEGKVVAWQGRSIDVTNSMRWYLPPGFQKTLYNYDGVSEIDVPVICEGITSALACGTEGTAIFGKTITNRLMHQLKSKWETLILATDPDTFVPDFRGNLGGKVAVDDLIAYLSPHFRLRLIQWPEVVLECARRNNKGEDIKVPDAADLGSQLMQKLIQGAV